MKTTILATLFSLCIASISAMAEEYDLQLEPCINGEVSASGLFPTQEDEDRFVRAQYEATNKAVDPCIDGDVS